MGIKYRISSNNGYIEMNDRPNKIETISVSFLCNSITFGARSDAEDYQNNNRDKVTEEIIFPIEEKAEVIEVQTL